MTRSVILAGGGSGGHLSPGLAIAERIQVLSPETSAFFVCSDRAIDRVMLEHSGATFTPIQAAPFSIRPKGLVRFLTALRKGTRQSSQTLKIQKAGVVLALGGFVSAPVVRAAKRQGIKTVLLNLDVVPGQANQWVAKRADQVYTALPLGEGVTLPHLVQQVEFPVRRAAVAPADAITCRERLGLSPHRQTLLITGASQGASTVNRLLERFIQVFPGALEEWEVLHLAGTGDRARLEKAYEKAGIKAVVLDFLNHMGLAWGAAELAISRAGANSVAEVALNQVPTIFVPYPWHKDLHQQFNAQSLVDAGSALLVTDRIEPVENMETIGVALRDLLLDPARRNEMRAAQNSKPAKDGAAEIAKLILAELG